MRDRFDVMVKEDLIDPDSAFIDDSGRQIGNRVDREALVAELAAQNFKPDLIIVDTLARHAVGVEENSAKEVGAWIAGVEALATEFECTVLLVHHVGKSAQSGMRGSSALSGAISTAIACEKKGGLVTLKCEKQKDADEFAPISFRTRKVRHGEIESLVLDYGEAGKPTRERLTADETAILAALEIAYPLTVKRPEFKRPDGSTIPDTEKLAHGEYLLRKSPSPNYPQESPLGIPSTPEKSPPPPPPYRGDGVGIQGGDKEVKELLERGQVPKFDELTSWRPTGRREIECLN
jgi:hypothetical protein